MDFSSKSNKNEDESKNILSQEGLNELVQNIMRDMGGEIETFSVHIVPDDNLDPEILNGLEQAKKEIEAELSKSVEKQKSKPMLPVPVAPKDINEGNYFQYNTVEVLYFNKQKEMKVASAVVNEDRVQREGEQTYYSSMYGYYDSDDAMDILFEITQRINKEYNFEQQKLMEKLQQKRDNEWTKE